MVKMASQRAAVAKEAFILAVEFDKKNGRRKKLKLIS
jgi:hypothetical protein